MTTTNLLFTKALPFSVFSLALTAYASAQNPLPATLPPLASDPINIDMGGTHQYDSWLNLSKGTQFRFDANGFAMVPGVGQHYPGFPGNVDWPAPINSQYYNYSGPTGKLHKISNGVGGGPFPSGATIYFGGTSPEVNRFGGELGASASAIDNLQTLAFQISIGEAYGHTFWDENGDGNITNDLPTLTLFDGQGAVISTLQATYHDIVKQVYNGSLDMPPGSGLAEDIYIKTFGLQWDLSAISAPISSFQVNWAGVEHSQLWALRLDQSDYAETGFVFDISSSWTGSVSDNWQDANNWSGGKLPATYGKAVFETGSSVTINQNTEIGQVVVRTANDFEINGATLRAQYTIATESAGASPVTHTINSNLNLPGIVTLDVGENTNLVINGNAAGVGIYRRGEGDLHLNGNNSISDNFVFSGGTTYVNGTNTAGSKAVAIEVKNSRVVITGNERFAGNHNLKLMGTSVPGQVAVVQLGTVEGGGVRQTFNSLDATKQNFVKDLNTNPTQVTAGYVVGGSSEMSTLVVKGGTYSGYLGGSNLYENNLSLEVIGNTTLQGASTYLGDTVIKSGAVLRVNRAAALSQNSNIVLDGGMLGLGSFRYIGADPNNPEGSEVRESFDRFTASVGSGAGEIRFSGDGGFYAYDATRYVNLGGEGATLRWGAANFLQTGNKLLLNSNNTSTDGPTQLVLENKLNLGNADRVIRVDGTGVGVLTGSIIGTTGGLVKEGIGSLRITSEDNTFRGGVSVEAGRLYVTKIANGGLSSSLGRSTSDASNLRLGSAPITGTGHLIYVGTEDASTDRAFTITGTQAVITNDSATGSLKFTSDQSVAFDHNDVARLALSGSNNSRENEFNLKVSDNGAYKTTLRKVGSGMRGGNDGVWTITREDNDYTGATWLSSGLLVVSKIANGGEASSIGASTSDAANLTLYMGGLEYVGSGDTTDRLFSIGTSDGNSNNRNRINSSGSGALRFVNTGALWESNSIEGDASEMNFGGILWLGGTNTDDNLLAAQIGGSLEQRAQLNKDGTGRWILTGNNSYAGATSIYGGVLSVSSLANGGIISNIGASTALAKNLVLDGGKLEYTGHAQNTNRLFTVGSNGGGIVSSGTGALRFTSRDVVAYTGTGDRTISLGGTNTDNNELEVSITDVAAQGGEAPGKVSILKEGEGRWVLSGSNSYSGTTIIRDGVLVAANNMALGESEAIVEGGNLLIQEGITLANDIILSGGSVNREIAVGSAYNLRAKSDFGNGNNVTASIVAAELASSATSLSFSFTNAASGGGAVASDILNIEGTGNDIFVLQLTLQRDVAGLELGWLDEVSGEWVNAVEGNSATGSLAGEYNLSWTEFSTLFSEHSYGDMLGAWGIDLSDNSIWAVVDHNSSFAAIPEPGTWGLLLGGAAVLGWFGRRRR